MKNLTLSQAIVIAVVTVVVGVLVYKGIIPAAVITGIIGWLIPSPMQPAKEEPS